MEILMELREVQLVEDPRASQVVVLGEVEGERIFPIFIGQYEAVQLDMALHKQRYPRPLTHDLVLNTIEAMGGRINRVIVDDLRSSSPAGGTFYGKLAVSMNGGDEVLVDSRPSDAIILATKVGAPIYVEDAVLEQVCREDEEEDEESGSEDEDEDEESDGEGDEEDEE